MIKEVQEVLQTREKPYNVANLTTFAIQELIKDNKIKKTVGKGGGVVYTETIVLKQR